MRTAAARPALFLDRDGVLNERLVGGYVLDPADLVHLDHVLGPARSAMDAGAAIVIVTNQGCIARGLAPAATIDAVNAAVVARLAGCGVRVDAVYTCPHHPDAPDPDLRTCDCRKPLPGLLTTAAADLVIELGASALIGDSATDIEAALAAGIGRDRCWLLSAEPDADERDRLEATAAHWFGGGPATGPSRATPPVG